MHLWLLLLYKVPREPSSHRVYIWRKLKRLGATLIHGAVWVLPKSPEALEQFQLLADEIREFGGNVLLWEAHLAIDEQDETLVQALQ